MGEKKPITRELAKNYRGADKKRKGEILVMVIGLTGYNRHYAAWLLRHHGKSYLVNYRGTMVKYVAGVEKMRKSAVRPRLYDERVKQVVQRLWECFDYMSGQRMAAMLKAMVPVLIGSGELTCSEEMKEKLMKISGASIDRLLKEVKQRMRVRGISHTKPARLLRSQIPICTWIDKSGEEPGHYEIDLVGHDGGIAAGEFAYSLNAIDLCSGWVELRILPNRAHRWTVEALGEIWEQTPVAMKSIHSDNGSEFLNHQMVRWAQEHQVAMSRTRPYRKNDSAHVEQKNFDIIRKAVGYARFDQPKELALIEELYRCQQQVVNHFYPSVKLIEKQRRGSRVHRVYDAPKSPYQRLMECEKLDEEVKRRLLEIHRRIRPMQLRKRINELQEQLYFMVSNKQLRVTTIRSLIAPKGEAESREGHG